VQGHAFCSVDGSATWTISRCYTTLQKPTDFQQGRPRITEEPLARALLTHFCNLARLFWEHAADIPLHPVDCACQVAQAMDDVLQRHYDAVTTLLPVHAMLERMEIVLLVFHAPALCGLMGGIGV